MAFSLLARMADGPLVEAGLFMNMMVELLNDGLLVVALALPASASTDFFSGELVEQCFLLFGFDGSILDGRRRQKKKWGGRRKGRKRKSPREKSRARAHFRESGVSPPKISNDICMLRTHTEHHFKKQQWDGTINNTTEPWPWRNLCPMRSRSYPSPLFNSQSQMNPRVPREWKVPRDVS